MTDLDLTGRKALVTGGAQGLGEGMAQALAARRRHGRRRRPAGRPRRQGGRVARARGHGFVHLDVTDDAGWEAAVAQRDRPARRPRHPGQQRRHRDHQPARRPRPGRRPQAARGQPARHRARHQARLPRDAPRRRGRQRRRRHQRRLGRRDHRVPRHRGLLGHQVGGRPAHPGRRDGVRQARLRRPRQLHLPGPRAHRDGRRAGQRRRPASACSARRRRRSARSSS